ncbi:MAG: hypothetical protein HN341_04735, partial [Verrucomicrobia bacterium]|nr:hypothetical protein [Verrucomicrobiota bacterium]
YGIDAAGSERCMVRGERSGQRITWKAVPFDRDELAAAVARGVSVACSMPTGIGLATWVRVPFSSTSKALRVFPSLLDIQLPFPLEECCSCFTEPLQLPAEALPFSVAGDSAALKGGEALVKPTPGVSALSLVARSVDVEARLAALADEGIDPHVLDCEGVALWTQALREIPPAAREGSPVRAIVFMRGQTGFMVIGRGPHFWSAHRVQAGNVLALGRFIRAQTRGSDQPLSMEWIWGGRDVDAPGPILEFRNDVEQRWPGRSITVDEPESFLARALATRALLPGPLRGNIRSGALAHAGAKARTDGTRLRSAMVLLVAGVLLCIVPSLWGYAIASRQRALATQFSARLNGMMGYAVGQKGAHAFLTAERELAARTLQREPIAAAFKPSLLADLTEALSGIGEFDVHIEHFALTDEGLQIRGSAPSGATETLLREAFSMAGYEAKVTLGDNAEDGERFAFVVSAVREVFHE